MHPKDSVTTHFTFCKKPWDCSEGLPGTVASETCLGLLKEWYAIRRELEDYWLSQGAEGGGKAGYKKDETITLLHQSREGTLDRSRYFGYCSMVGTEGYNRLVPPDVKL